MVLSGVILTIRLGRFQPSLSECDKFDDPDQKQIIKDICKLTLKPEHFEIVTRQDDAGRKEHEREPGNSEQKGFKVLDVGPVNHIHRHTESRIDRATGLRQGRNTDGVFFKPNLSTQQSPPPMSVSATKNMDYWGRNRDEAKLKQDDVQNNRDRLKPLYLQAKVLFQQLRQNQESKKTYHEVGNLDDLLERNHQITTVAKAWDTSREMFQQARQARANPNRVVVPEDEQ